MIECRVAICGHSFCEQCIQEWLLRRSECPVCRKEIRKYKMTSSKSIDQLVFLIVNKKNCIEERKKYEERRRNFE